VVFADDTIFAGPNGEQLEKEIASRRVQSQVVILSSCRMKEKLGISQVKKILMNFISHSTVLQKN